MRILVTGAAGFVGKHLLQELISHSHQPIAVDLKAGCKQDNVTWHECDILNPNELNQIATETKPDACIHLAGIAYVPVADINPEIMLSINNAEMSFIQVCLITWLRYRHPITLDCPKWLK